MTERTTTTSESTHPKDAALGYYSRLIYDTLVQTYQDVEIQFCDQSAQHRGHAGIRDARSDRETHLMVTLHVPALAPLKVLDRNRRLMEMLAPVTLLGQAGGLHALSLRWSERRERARV